MLGRTFESPNAIDAGDAPPPHPSQQQQRRRSTFNDPRRHRINNSQNRASPRSVVVRPVGRLVKGEHLFRGTRIKIEEEEAGQDQASCSSSCDDNESAASNHPENEEEENCVYHYKSRRSSSFEDDASIVGSREIYEGDEEEGTRSITQLGNSPSPHEARLYAEAILTSGGSFRRGSDNSNNNSNSNYDTKEEELAALQDNFGATETDDNIRLLPFKSSSAMVPIADWRRPSRRKHLDLCSSSNIMLTEVSRSKKMNPRIIIYSILLVIAVITLIVTISVVATKKKSGDNSPTKNTNSSETAHLIPASTTIGTIDGTPRFLATVDWLSRHHISNYTDLVTEGSPQYQAAVWMADLDVLREEVPANVVAETFETNTHDLLKEFNATNSGTVVTNEEKQEVAYHQHVKNERFLQRYVLAVLYFATNGGNWTDNLKFLSEMHECSWFRTEQGNDDQEYAVGITCNSKLLVKNLFLVANKLQGQIPSELQYLQHLELLSFRNNALEGSLPTELEHLSSTLAYLDASKNSLAGVVPSMLGKLTKLRALGLAQNMLEGRLTNKLALLTNLITLDLQKNQLVGNANLVLGGMSNLEYLYLGYNAFTDMVDASFLVNLSKLRELDLSNNLFASAINAFFPTHLLSHSQLTFLDMSNNQLQAPFAPTVIAPTSATSGTATINSVLRYLSLKNNQMINTIPLQIQALRGLQYLSLENNALSGSVPVSLGNMKELTHLYLGNNSFSPGPIPPTLFTISSLQKLSLPNAEMTGIIPQWVTLLSELEYINLSDNSLTSTIPDDIWAMPKLNTLLLGGNSFISALPTAYPDSQLGKQLIFV